MSAAHGRGQLGRRRRGHAVVGPGRGRGLVPRTVRSRSPRCCPSPLLIIPIRPVSSPPPEPSPVPDEAHAQSDAAAATVPEVPSASTAGGPRARAQRRAAPSERGDGHVPRAVGSPPLSRAGTTDRIIPPGSTHRRGGEGVAIDVDRSLGAASPARDIRHTRRAAVRRCGRPRRWRQPLPTGPRHRQPAPGLQAVTTCCRRSPQLRRAVPIHRPSPSSATHASSYPRRRVDRGQTRLPQA